MSDTARPVSPERLRLDRALVDAGQGADRVSRAQIEAFEAMLRVRRRAVAGRGQSLREEIGRLTMPEISDPSIFTAARSIEILDHLVHSVLPRLDAEEEVSMIATAMLEEELERTRDLAARLDEGRAS